MKKTAFFLENYKFEKVYFDFSNQKSTNLDIKFVPEGVFDALNSSFDLIFTVNISEEESVENPLITIRCVATFKFTDTIDFESIPNYFYQNSLAIIFPYVRAFVSTITLQSNIPSLMLPTLNLSSLEAPLRESTTQKR